MRRRTVLAAAGAAVVAAPALAGLEAPAIAADAWQLRWSPEASVDGLGAFEGVEDDRADSHPAGQPHIFVQDNNFRWNMHMVDRDSSTDRQRQEVKGMRQDGRTVAIVAGETWRFSYDMFLPGTLQAARRFTHVMQIKVPNGEEGDQRDRRHQDDVLEVAAAPIPVPPSARASRHGLDASK